MAKLHANEEIPQLNEMWNDTKPVSKSSIETSHTTICMLISDVRAHRQSGTTENSLKGSKVADSVEYNSRTY